MRKCKNYVAIIEYDGTLSYVTGMDNATRIAYWEEGKPALDLSASVADSLMDGLLCNGYKAVVIKAADFLTLTNSRKENNTW